ncbi:MAG: hypothetical protein ABIC82_01340 [bacterium]
MKLFITATFKHGENQSEIEHLCNIAKQAGFNDFCFIRDIENYQNFFDNPLEMMAITKQEIKSCDALLIDLTHKSTGRAIEAGIAYAMNKKIIVLVKRGVLLKDTAKGITDIVIEYENIDDIVPELKKFLSKICVFQRPKGQC